MADTHLAPTARRPVHRAPSPVVQERRRLLAIGVVLALLCTTVPAMASYGKALTGPGTDSLAIRSTEWLRTHHFRWLVNDVEAWYYTHNAPRAGGRPSAAGASELTTRHAAATSHAAPAPTARAVLPDPAPVPPLVADPTPGEGHWTTIASVAGVPAVEAAYLRPDAVHTSLVSALAWIDPKVVRAVGYAGATEPGGTWTDQAPIADALRPTLVAAFNSGFRMQDSQGGYYADGRLARPLVDGRATAWVDRSGVLHIGKWGRDVAMGPDVVMARQNLSLIVDGGAPVPDVSSSDTTKWGATVGNKVLVWRSGMGVTADGALIYAAGNGLSAASLAGLLARAGAQRAMELDINSAWTCFFTYGPAPAGAAPADLTVSRLLADMRPSTTNYLTPSSRDFFALFAR